MKILSLVTDAFGGRGGIAQFNRDMLTALNDAPGVSEITAVPRLVADAPETLPSRVRFLTEAASGKPAFLGAVVREVITTRYDVVICGHMNLLPVAVIVAWLRRSRLVLVLYGIEAWAPAGNVRRRMLRRVDDIVSISKFTRGRFMDWSGVSPDRLRVIPCCVDTSRFGVGPKREDLQRRYGLQGRTVIMTLGRLAGAERYKGFDEVMSVLPELSRSLPRLSYLIIGDGPDRERLEQKASDLGVSEQVVFAGYIDESEKADHYRLADLFVMAGRGEGFGIVYLEAMACGIPVVASSADASKETVLDGRAGEVVDPTDSADISAGILRAIRNGRREADAALEHFSYPRFRQRWHRLLNSEAG